MNRITLRIAAPLVAALAIALVAVNGALAQTAPAASGDATRGKATFMKFGCYECHGTLGQGNYFGAPHIAPHPLPYAGIVAYIRKPAGLMPSYSAAILPDKDVADIAAYLASIPIGKSAAEIPLLNATTMKPK